MMECIADTYREYLNDSEIWKIGILRELIWVLYAKDINIKKTS